MMRTGYLAAAALAGLLSLAACGGGGGGLAGGGGNGGGGNDGNGGNGGNGEGGGGSPVSTPDDASTPTRRPPPDVPGPADFETPEYRAQSGLGLISAAAIYARGGTGKGVTVGVFDSGASPEHPELAGKYVFTGAASDLEPVDDSGHGTHVAGIVAARRDGTGMHGVAYDARLASYRITDPEGNVVATDPERAVGIDEMRRRGIHIVNNSWAADETILDMTRSEIAERIPESLAAYQSYVAAGGVQVWSSLNQRGSPVSFYAGAPARFPELEKGWLAVVAVDLEGREASYTSRCGVAADWCLAAPGGDRAGPGAAAGARGVYSTVPPRGYGRKVGISMAAPHVAGALAALKSLFPNLSYQALRDRLLFTADDSGPYADESIFGQGLLDLDAASRPVGATSFPLGADDRGEVATTEGAAVVLPPAALSRYLTGRHILVLDAWQRAPFLVPAAAFARAGGAYLSFADLDLAPPERLWDGRDRTVTLAVAGDDFRARGVSNGAWFVGSGRGAGVTEGMAHLVGAPLPHGRYRMADDALGLVFGLASDRGEFYAGAALGGAAGRTGAGFGIAGWSPETVLAASFVADGGGPPSSVETFGASLASALKRPLGWAGAGALELTGDSVELAYGRGLAAGESWRLGIAGRLAHLATDAGPLVRFDDALLAATELDLSLELGAATTLGLRLGTERPLTAGRGRIRAASGIDESGRLAYDDILIDGSDLLAFDRIGLSVRYAPDRTGWTRASLGAGVTAVRDGFGETEAIAGARARVRF